MGIVFKRAEDIVKGDFISFRDREFEVTRKPRVRELADGIKRIYFRLEGRSKSLRRRLKVRVPVVTE